MFPRSLNEQLSSGFAVGLQGYGLLLLSEESGGRLIAGAGDWPIGISLATGIILALSIQMMMARTLARAAAAGSMRDTFLALSVCHLVATMTPGPLWFHLGLIGWILSLTAWLMASGRWLLLAPDVNSRWTRAALSVLGAAFGAGFAKLGRRGLDSLDAVLFLGIVVSLAVAWQLHALSRRSPAPAARPAMMRWSDFVRDPRMLAYACLAFCLGLSGGWLLFRSAPYGAVVQSIAVTLVVLRALQNRVGPMLLVRVVLYLAALLLAADLLLLELPAFTPYALAAAGITLYTCLHAGAYEPRVLLSALDRLCVLNGGILTGVLAAGALAWSRLDPERSLGAIAFALIMVPYFASFLPEEAFSYLREQQR